MCVSTVSVCKYFTFYFHLVADTVVIQVFVAIHILLKNRNNLSKSINMSSAEEIQLQINKLQDQLNKMNPNKIGKREKIEKLSAEVVDSNPYSRLMALQRMGIVSEYERIRQKSVAVVGKIVFSFIYQNICLNNILI